MPAQGSFGVVGAEDRGDLLVQETFVAGAGWRERRASVAATTMLLQVKAAGPCGHAGRIRVVGVLVAAVRSGESVDRGHRTTWL
jgi:hypothetical protein